MELFSQACLQTDDTRMLLQWQLSKKAGALNSGCLIVVKGHAHKLMLQSRLAIVQAGRRMHMQRLQLRRQLKSQLDRQSVFRIELLPQLTLQLVVIRSYTD